MTIDKRHVEAELNERRRRTQKSFNVENFLFPEQLAFVNEQATYSTACCSRRAGKTEGIIYDLLREAVTKDGITALYLTLSRSNAKKLVWSKLQELNRKHNLEGLSNENELSMTFPNRSVIYVSGAKDKVSIEKYRGLSLSLCYIDEAQSFGSFIQELVDDIISKALYDQNGRLKLTGTPGPVPAGYFYDVCQSKQWAHHRWTMFENTYLIKKGNKLTVDGLIDQDCKRKGVTRDDPSIQRECFGKWVTDLNSLVLKYDSTKNHFDQIPTSDSIHTVIGIDTGFNDSDSISIVQWADDRAEAWLAHEHVQPKQGWEALSAEIRALEAQYKPERIVIDPANGAKKFIDDLNQRFGLSIEVADKTRKIEFLELLNDALRTGKFLAPSTSIFAQDCMKVEWDFDVKTQKRKVSDRFHSDAIDSTLYAFRASQHWLFEPTDVKPRANTREWYRAEEARMEAQAIAAYQKKHDPFGSFDDSDF